jgi:hypothetical protein
MIGIGGGSGGHSGALSGSSFHSPLLPPSPLAVLPASVAPSSASIRLPISFWLGVPPADEEVGRVPASAAAELVTGLAELVLLGVLLGTALDTELSLAGEGPTVPALLGVLGGGPASTIATPASRLGSGSSLSGPSAQAESSTSHQSAPTRKAGARGRNAGRSFVCTPASCHIRCPLRIDRS